MPPKYSGTSGCVQSSTHLSSPLERQHRIKQVQVGNRDQKAPFTQCSIRPNSKCPLCCFSFAASFGARGYFIGITSNCTPFNAIQKKDHVLLQVQRWMHATPSDSIKHWLPYIEPVSNQDRALDFSFCLRYFVQMTADRPTDTIVKRSKARAIPAAAWYRLQSQAEGRLRQHEQHCIGTYCYDQLREPY